MYVAGLRQLEDKSLTKKHSIGHPVNNRKSSSGFVDDSEEVSDLESKRDNKKKNKSLYDVPFKKYTSKEVSNDNTDEIEFRNTGFGNFNPYNEEMMNERYNSTTMQMELGNRPPSKPILGTSRNSMTANANKR